MTEDVEWVHLDFIQLFYDWCGRFVHFWERSVKSRAYESWRGRFLSSTTPIRPLIQSDNHLYTNMITKVDIFRSPQLNDRNIFFGLLDFWGDFLFLTKNAWNIIIISYIYIFILRIKMFLDVISIVMFCLAYSPVCYCFCFMIWLWR